MQRFMIVAILLAAGCGAESAAEQAAQAKRVYWDTETKQPVAANMTAESPAVNPTTGRRTLMPALYCPKCGDWRAAPPLAEIQRNPKSRMCVKCGGPLVADGPIPDATTASAEKSDVP
jgi:hypothetical protein